MDKVKLNYNKGFSLVEVIVAMGVFVLGMVTISYMIFDASVSARFGIERTKAVMFSQEGIEAVRSIRNNDFSSLAEGTYGLVINNNQWVLSGTSDQQDQFTRIVNIENIDDDTKKITSTVSWDFSGSRNSQVETVTYVTNWQESTISFLNIGEYCQFMGYYSGTCEKNTGDCTGAGGFYESGGDEYCSVPNVTGCCFEESSLPNNVDEYCQSIGYYSGTCEKKLGDCTGTGGFYESGGDGFCSTPTVLSCCFEESGLANVDEYCQSIGYYSGTCEETTGDCTGAGGYYESGGDTFCSSPTVTGCCFEEPGPANVDEYCQSIGYYSGTCEETTGDCTGAGGYYESGGDIFCSSPTVAGCCFEETVPPANINEYCQSIGYTSGGCEKKLRDCTDGGGTYESGGDVFCLSPTKLGCCS